MCVPCGRSLAGNPWPGPEDPGPWVSRVACRPHPPARAPTERAEDGPGFGGGEREGGTSCRCLCAGPCGGAPASLQQVATSLPPLPWAQHCDFLGESQNLGSETRTHLRSAPHWIQAGCTDSCSENSGSVLGLAFPRPKGRESHTCPTVTRRAQWVCRRRRATSVHTCVHRWALQPVLMPGD